MNDIRDIDLLRLTKDHLTSYKSGIKDIAKLFNTMVDSSISVYDQEINKVEKQIKLIEEGKNND